MTFDAVLNVATHPAVTFAVGGVCGFIATRFTMTKAERAAHKQRLYENSVRHNNDRAKLYRDFCNAMERYKAKDGPSDLNDFHAVATSGDLYFNELKVCADAILSGSIDRSSRDNTLVPLMRRTIETTLPLYHDTLRAIASKLGAKFDGDMKREEYESIFQVVEKFGTGIQPFTPSAANTPSRSG